MSCISRHDFFKSRTQNPPRHTPSSGRALISPNARNVHELQRLRRTTTHMTSTSQPTDKTAPNSAASSTPSYASAAGATKKSSTPGPLVVTGANPSSAAGPAAKPASASSVNGRQSVPPAVPTVANGASSLNGDAANHARNGSVTIAAPGNGYNNKAAAPGIQFGFEKTPQPTPAAPVTIPGAARVPSPSHSPSPIPQSSVSGGKPGSTDNAFKIGSFNNDGDVSS